MEQFKEGDIVYLKSGSHKMTISFIDRDGNYRCIWFLDGKLEAATFNSSVITKEDPEKKALEELSLKA